jgi:predicted O-methyltransferase YrrM
VTNGTDHAPRDVTFAAVSGIPGWMTHDDFSAITFVLSTQVATEPPGALAELGVYQGKSAVLIGGSRRDDELFTVVDLFEDGAETDPANTRENAREYDGLSQRQFEDNYLSVHSALPHVVKGPSTRILEAAPHGAHRFVHIDASHLYDHVRADIDAAKVLLRPDGVVVLDDYRSAHTPGVAAATWAAVAHGLRPFLLTNNKFYGTWGDADRWTAALSSWLAESRLEHEIQSIAGSEVHRLWSARPAGARWVPPVAVPYARAMRRRLLARRGRP